MGVLNSRPPRRSFRALLSAASAAVLGGLLIVGFALVAAPTAASAVDDEGLGISVDVIAPAGNGGGSGNGSAPRPTPIVDVEQETMPPGDAAEEALGNDSFDLGGIMQISGLSGEVIPALHPRGGDIELSVTVRSAASEAIDLDMRFWLDNPGGQQVRGRTGVVVADLAPRETRVVRVTLRDLGQWALLHGHVTVTPPASVDGVELVPVTRDATLFLPPYFALTVGGGAVAGAIALLGLPAVAGFGGFPGIGRLIIGLVSRGRFG